MQRRRTVQVIVLSIGFLAAEAVLASGTDDKWGVGFNVNAQKLYGDSRTGDFVFGVTPLVLRYGFKPSFYLESEASYSRLSTQPLPRLIETNMVSLGLKLGHRFMHRSVINPLVYIGVGAFNFQINSGTRYWDGYGAVGGGAEIFLNHTLGLNLTGDFRYTTGDEFDGRTSVTGRDGFFNLAFGLNYYWSGREPYQLETEMSEDLTAQEARLDEVDASHAEATATDVTIQTDSIPGVESWSMLREALAQSLAEKSETVRLLRAKVEAAEQQTRALEGRLVEAGVTPFDSSTMRMGSKALRFLAVYQSGLDYFKKQLYDEAIVAFKELLDLGFAETLESYCWYWLGECYYAKDAYDLAIVAFDRVLSDTPASPKVQAAQIMMALSRLRAGDKREASALFEGLMTHYPDSEFAPLAQEYLLKLQGELN